MIRVSINQGCSEAGFGCDIRETRMKRQAGGFASGGRFHSAGSDTLAESVRGGTAEEGQ